MLLLLILILLHLSPCLCHLRLHAHRRVRPAAELLIQLLLTVLPCCKVCSKNWMSSLTHTSRPGTTCTLYTARKENSQCLPQVYLCWCPSPLLHPSQLLLHASTFAAAPAPISLPQPCYCTNACCCYCSHLCHCPHRPLLPHTSPSSSLAMFVHCFVYTTL